MADASIAVGEGKQLPGEAESETDQVLIEKDGKFELLRVSDMQARPGGEQKDASTRDNPSDGGPSTGEMQPTAHAQSSPGATGSVGVTLNLATASEASSSEREEVERGGKVSSTLGESTRQQNVVHGPQMTEGEKEEEMHKTVTSSETLKERSVEPVVPAAPADEVSKSDSGSKVQIVTGEQIQERGASATPTITKPPRPSLAAASTASLRPASRRVSRPRGHMGRTKSAPGTRLTYSPTSGDTEEELRKKRMRNEAAFAAWLAKKNAAMSIKRKGEQSRMTLTEEEVERKRKMNQAAFEAWLTAKNQEHHPKQESREASLRPATSAEKDKGEAYSEAFRHWLSQKQEQKHRERLMEERRKSELEDAARRVDPAIVEQSYKR